MKRSKHTQEEQEIIKLRAKINQIERKRRINKIDKPLAKLIKGPRNSI
jgi:hypothetical protein